MKQVPGDENEREALSVLGPKPVASLEKDLPVATQ